MIGPLWTYTMTIRGLAYTITAPVYRGPQVQDLARELEDDLLTRVRTSPFIRWLGSLWMRKGDVRRLDIYVVFYLGRHPKGSRVMFADDSPLKMLATCEQALVAADWYEEKGDVRGEALRRLVELGWPEAAEIRLWPLWDIYQQLIRKEETK